MGTVPDALVRLERYNRRHNRPAHKPCRCKICGRFSPSVSWKGYCTDCSVNKVKQVIKEEIEGKGHYHNKWKQGLKAFILGK
jgi:hypothetical protein